MHAKRRQRERERRSGRDLNCPAGVAATLAVLIVPVLAPVCILGWAGVCVLGIENLFGV